MIPVMKANGSSELTGFVEFPPNFEDVLVAMDKGLLLKDAYKEVAIENDETEMIKKGDIVVHVRTVKRLKIILPNSEEKNIRSIFFGEVYHCTAGSELLFLDILNKELVTGVELIKQYRNQLPLIQKLCDQPFNLIYDEKGNNKTLKRSLIWQVGKQFYIIVDNQLKEMEISEKDEQNETTILKHQGAYQTQIQIPPKK